ncbi:MAG: hypothetical protein V1816_20665 [Pseudomonadota bacterium]
MPNHPGSIAEEVENRLNEIFHDEADKTIIMEDGALSALTSPIKDLKSIVLSMDWEINDQTLERFGQEVAKLLKVFQDDKKKVVLLKLLSSLGRYIKKKRHAAHPDSIKTLHSVYGVLEKIILERDVPEESQKRLVAAEVKKFKDLQEKVIPPSAETEVEPSGPPDMALTRSIEPQEYESAGTEPLSIQTASIDDYAQTQPLEEDEEPSLLDFSRMTPQEAAAFVLLEVQRTIKAEVRKLRDEIMSLLEMDAPDRN